MLNQLKKESNKTCTENGALTLKTTNSYCLDLFSTIGALRYASDQEIVGRFLRAYAENKDQAMKILFFARDVRGGLGERKVFRNIVSYIAKNKPGVYHQKYCAYCQIWALRRSARADRHAVRATDDPIHQNAARSRYAGIAKRKGGIVAWEMAAIRKCFE